MSFGDTVHVIFRKGLSVSSVLSVPLESETAKYVKVRRTSHGGGLTPAGRTYYLESVPKTDVFTTRKAALEEIANRLRAKLDKIQAAIDAE